MRKDVGRGEALSTEFRDFFSTDGTAASTGFLQLSDQFLAMRRESPPPAFLPVIRQLIIAHVGM